MRKNAKRQGSRVLNRAHRDMGSDLKDMAGAMFGYGKSALADLLHRQLEASEYVLHPDRLEILSPTGAKYVPYDQIQEIRVKGDRFVLMLGNGKVTIKPHAYILSGTLKVPVGWQRNGMEVAYEMLLDELSARAGVNIEHL